MVDEYELGMSLQPECDAECRCPDTGYVSDCSPRFIGAKFLECGCIVLLYQHDCEMDVEQIVLPCGEHEVDR